MTRPPYPSLRRRSAYRRATIIAALLAAGAWAWADGPAEAPALNIGVRSSVDQRWHGVHKLGAIAHGKVYLIAAIKEAPAVANLVQPVNEGRLLQLLRAELNARGFAEITPDQTPDIVLTVLYGRGWLHNPYLKGTILDEESDVAPVATIVTPDQAFREREPGYEAKLQAAQHEKLFIRLTAWKYPGTATEKPAELWATTMVLDRPDKRDLNQVAREMLAVGAGYFDREVKEPEVIINTASRQGRVILAPLKILEDEAPAK